MSKLIETEIKQIAYSSPALEWQSDKPGKFSYPANFRGRVPLKVKMATTVYSDVPYVKPYLAAKKDEEYFVYVNSYGAVAAIFPTGEKLGLRPQEFDVIEWHKQESKPESDNH